MSPAKLSDALQASFVRAQLEAGYRMLELAAKKKRKSQEFAPDPLSLARIALIGAEEHLAATSLPRAERRALFQAARELRRAIESVETGASARAFSGAVTCAPKKKLPAGSPRTRARSS